MFLLAKKDKYFLQFAETYSENEKLPTCGQHRINHPSSCTRTTVNISTIPFSGSLNVDVLIKGNRWVEFKVNKITFRPGISCYHLLDFQSRSLDLLICNCCIDKLNNSSGYQMNGFLNSKFKGLLATFLKLMFIYCDKHLLF